MKMASKKPSARSLKALLAALEEIESGFAWAGFDIPVADNDVISDAYESASEENSGAELEEEEYIESSDDGSMYDREDIEIAIDAFLSELKKDGVIRKNKKGRLPSFSEVFCDLFGSDNELVSKAREFEEFIEGYFGFVSFEAMSDARTKFVEIRSSVEEALKRC